MANAPIRPSGSQTVDIIMISSLQLSSKQATLSSIPAIPSKTIVTSGGVAQTYGIDFIIVGNVISWASMGLDSILSVGDEMIVEYFKL